MTVERIAGSIDAQLLKALNVLPPAAVKRATGKNLNSVYRIAHPNSNQALSLEDAARLDGELIRAGEQPMFREVYDQLVAAQAGERRPQQADCQGLSQALLHLGGELGELQHRAQAAMDDGVLSKRERATLAHEAQDVIDGAQAIRDALEPPYADVVDDGAANVEPIQRRAN